MNISFRILSITLVVAGIGFFITNQLFSSKPQKTVEIGKSQVSQNVNPLSDTQSSPDVQENKVLGTATETEVSLQDLPTELQKLFNQDSLLIVDKITRTDFTNGQTEWKWFGSSKRNLRESYTGWRSRLAENWILSEGARSEENAFIVYKNYTSEVRVDLKVKNGEVLQTISIIQSK